MSSSRAKLTGTLAKFLYSTPSMVKITSGPFASWSTNDKPTLNVAAPKPETPSEEVSMLTVII